MLAESSDLPISLGASNAVGSCDVIERWTNGIKLRADLTSQALLMISEAACPGWRVWIDEKPEKVIVLDGRFLGAQEEHEVLFKFRPTYLWHGILLSAILI